MLTPQSPSGTRTCEGRGGGSCASEYSRFTGHSFKGKVSGFRGEDVSQAKDKAGDG